METKTYIVALHKDVDYDSFWSDIESPTSGLPHIPDRAVSIVNSRDAFLRICEYALTDDEAERVRNDPRVVGVDLPIEDNPFVKIGIVSTQTGNFNKQSGYIGTNSPDYSDSTRINWGLVQHTNVNAYGTSLTTTENYKYALDGTGVDVIISDTGIQSNHPEFQFSGNTTSRVQYIDWSTYVPALSTMGNSYQDSGAGTAAGHGTHVSGTVAGKTYGWAKNSNIYSINVVGTNPGAVLDVLTAMKLFHTSKTNGRPTVVNMSWASLYDTSRFGTTTVQQMTNFLANITGGRYQGSTYSGNANVANYGILANVSIPNDQNSWVNGFPYPYPSLDVVVDEMTGNGIVVCRAAGNSQYKTDKPSSLGGSGDWDNYITVLSTNVYYHRGFSPTSNNAIVVGALDTTTNGFEPGKLQRVYFSNAGPGVDVYAAGTYIMSAGANTSPGTYFSTSFKSLVDSGTSMASPQVAGIAALYLQAHPTATPAQVKHWIVSHADTSLLYSASGNSTTYSNRVSLLGGSGGIAMAPLGVARVKTDATTWANVANVKIKTGATTWSNVKYIWTKTVNGWAQSF